MQTRKPRDFDWVTERQNCSAARYLERLVAVAQANVRTRNEQKPGVSFGVESLSGQGFSVFLEGEPGKAVRVRVEGETFHIEGSSSVRGSFTGVLRLCDDGECRLRVGQDDLDEWQVLRRALERLFFPGV